MTCCMDCSAPIESGTRRQRCVKCSLIHRRKVSREWKKNNPGENARHQRDHRNRKDEPK